MGRTQPEAFAVATAKALPAALTWKLRDPARPDPGRTRKATHAKGPGVASRTKQAGLGRDARARCAGAPPGRLPDPSRGPRPAEAGEPRAVLRARHPLHPEHTPGSRPRGVVHARGRHSPGKRDPGLRNRGSDREGGRHTEASQQPFVRLCGGHRRAPVTSVIQTARQWRGGIAGTRLVPPPPGAAGTAAPESPFPAHAQALRRPGHFSHRGRLMGLTSPLTACSFDRSRTEVRKGEHVYPEP